MHQPNTIISFGVASQQRGSIFLHYSSPKDNTTAGKANNELSLLNAYDDGLCCWN